MPRDNQKNSMEKEISRIENEEERLKNIIQGNLSQYLGGRNPFTMNTKEEREQLRGYMIEIVSGMSEPTFLRRFQLEDFYDRLIMDLTSLGVLSELLEDDSVSEIMVNGYDDIWVERNGRTEKTDIAFRNEEELFDMGVRIARNVGRNLDMRNTMVDARLPDMSRVNIITSPNYLGDTAITIRKFNKKRLTIDDLIEGNTLNEEIADFLKAAVISKANILVSGGTNTGKTTNLNILSNFIPKEERVITIEDSAELQLTGDHILSLETTEANAEGEGEVTMTDLLKNTLRMNPSRIIVGEVRDHTAYDLLNSMNTGHDGAMSTVHANSPNDCVIRLNNMISERGYNFSLETVYAMIGAGVDLIIQLYEQGGQRYISEISQVYLGKDRTLEMDTLFRFEIDKINENGRVTGEFVKANVKLNQDMLLKFRRRNINPEDYF